MIITGSAPIAKEVLEFLKAVVGCHIVEGYGQTESMGGSFNTLHNDTRFGVIF